MKLSLLCFCILTVVTHGQDLQKRHGNDNLCDHPDCYLFAAKIAAGIDSAINPCQDFWKYACGNWAKELNNPNHQEFKDTIRLQTDEVELRLKGILSAPAAEDDPAMIRNAKLMYQSCVYPDYQVNLKQIKSYLNQFGGWKLGTSKTLAWKDVMQLMMKMMPTIDTVLPFSILVRSKSNENTQSFIVMTTPIFEDVMYPVDLPAKDIVALASEVNPSVNKRQALVDAKEMLSLKSVLQKMPKPGAGFQLMNIESLNNYTKVNWLPLFQQIFYGIKNITSNENLAVDNLEYFQKLVKYASTPKGAKNMMNYISFLMVKNMFNSMRNRLPFHISSLSFLYNIRSPKIEERWSFCIDKVHACYAEALAWKYGRMYHEIDKERTMANEMTTMISDAMKTRLEKLDWLDDSSRKAALNKLQNIQRYYEYLPWIDDVEKVSKHYDKLVMYSTIVTNDKNCEAHARRDTLTDIILPARQKTWSTPLQVNAFYNPMENNIRILEGILDAPIFALNRLRVMNFAGLGYIVGHEITHGFDNHGVKYNSDGNQLPWLTKQSQTKFNERTQCLVDQYNNFMFTKEELPGSTDSYHVNGTTTLGENIADHGGLRLSYDAYQEFIAKNGKEQMPSILMENHFTEPQIFFLSFAQSWCGKYYYFTKWKASLDRDVHATDKFRINGPLSNFKEFSDAFNCPANSPMNRGDASCKVW